LESNAKTTISYISKKPQYGASYNPRAQAHLNAQDAHAHISHPMPNSSAHGLTFHILQILELLDMENSIFPQKYEKK
jgi:hypothetical protein